MNSESKHTPGPWEVGPVDDTVVTHIGADGVRYEVAAIDGDYNQPDEWPVMEANARLIAAAPDMAARLEAQERLIETLTKALEPFAPKQLADFEEILWGEYGDDQPASLTVKLGDIRRARTALAQARKG